MPIDLNTLINEARCLGCGSMSESEMITAALLQRIAEAGSTPVAGGTPDLPLNSLQFNEAGAFGGSADLVWRDNAIIDLSLISRANSVPLGITGYSLTGANASSVLNMSGTWNTTGNPVALRLAITNTASGATAKFLEFLAGAGGATSVFTVEKNGSVGLPNIVTALFNSAETNSAFGFSLGNPQIQKAGSIIANFGASGVVVNGYLGFPVASADVAIQRQAAGILQVNSTVLNTLRDISLRNIITNNAAAALTTATTLTDFAAAALGTLTNAPTAGPPAKWIAIVDNGTTRYIPTWV